MLFPCYRNTDSSGSVLGTGAVDERDHLSGAETQHFLENQALEATGAARASGHQ